MEHIGLIRRIDSLGRFVIPKEYREFYHIKNGDALEIYMTKEGILIKKPEFEVIPIADKTE